jgi:hypothetical protein
MQQNALTPYVEI